LKANTFACLLASLSAVAVLQLSSCTSPQNAGEEVLPDGTTVYFTDTFSLGMSTILLDTVTTGQLSRNLIGNYLDEAFGWIDCETYIQPRITGSNLVFGSDPTKLRLDSLVLSLDLLDFYGRFDDPLRLEIFRITQAFEEGKKYNSRDSLLVDKTVDFANDQKIDFSGLPGYYDVVKYRLSDSLGKYLLFAPVDSLASQSTFTSYFKGILIRTKKADPQLNREPGGVFIFDPKSTKTSLTLYYHDSTSTKSYTFPINDASKRFHRVQRLESDGKLIQSAQNTGGTTATQACIQAGSLVKVHVDAPSLSSLDPAGIHRAELVLPVDPAYLGSNNRFSPPTSLFLYVADSTGKAEFSSSTFNATADYNGFEKAYILPITQTLQQILAGRLPNNGFLLVPGNNGVSVNRAVLAGPAHPDVNLRPKIRVTYTKIGS
jgi:hypothetical protein